MSTKGVNKEDLMDPVYFASMSDDKWAVPDLERIILNPHNGCFAALDQLQLADPP